MKSFLELLMFSLHLISKIFQIHVLVITPLTLWHERAPQFGQHFEGGPRNAAAMRRGRFGF